MCVSFWICYGNSQHQLVKEMYGVLLSCSGWVGRGRRWEWTLLKNPPSPPPRPSRGLPNRFLTPLLIIFIIFVTGPHDTFWKQAFSSVSDPHKSWCGSGVLCSLFMRIRIPERGFLNSKIKIIRKCNFFLSTLSSFLLLIDFTIELKIYFNLQNFLYTKG